MREFPNILTIAGTDPGGGAGIQADLKTATVLKGFGLSVITALVAQNGAGVKGIMPVPPDFVALQLQTVYEGFEVHAAKTGMLCNAPIMEALVPELEKRSFPLVVDPVCVSQSGHKLIEDDAIDVLRKKIVPQADLLTPNVPEAEVLSGVTINSMQDMEKAVATLLKSGAKAVLMKGGHFNVGGPGSDKSKLTDWLCTADGNILPLEHERIATNNNHGTGCTISAAITTFLGMGYPLEEAVKKGQQFLLRALKYSFHPGKIGAGPVNFVAGAGL
ncbi:bifunctional hydroxymethylpyrimidine kinase/phosphomethylpyrimidine kinase [Desulfovibrio sp. OttesenSCG-928-C06]|nr:bifunctional hydroxymethylpyrimidine kinase/phosphomethylpyrimidine kinase [Desulfovibrio sp. OttesenSCG-928-C06]